MSTKTPSTPRSPSNPTTPTRAYSSTPRRRSFKSATTTPFRNVASFINTPSSARKTPGDRFIPNRAATNLEFSSHEVRSAGRVTRPEAEGSPAAEAENRRVMREKLLSLRGCSSDTRVLNFKQTQASSPSSAKTPGKYQYWSPYAPNLSSSGKKKARKVPKTAEKVLDAPNLLNDFYLNILDWSKKDQLAIALAGSVYILNTDSGSITQLCNMETESAYVSSLKWNKSGKYLAIGTSNAEIQLWDANSAKLVRRMQTQETRVTSLAWNPKSSVLSCGLQSGQIHNYDPRAAQFHVNTLKSHSLDVCGLSWSANGRFLASGGNDNLINVWDMYSRDPWSIPARTFREHTAAVKALSWCPWQPSLLASGGGSADKHIRLWNVSTGTMVASQNTGSQVSGLLWSVNHHELLSSHGQSQNQLTIWRHAPSSPSLVRLADLLGHEERILNVSVSPDGQTVASTAADETLRFWKCFAVDSRQLKDEDLTNSSLTELHLARHISLTVQTQKSYPHIEYILKV